MKLAATSRRRWGYLLWMIAGAVIGVPEITAAADNGALPFTTISAMTGHLERHHTWVELVVVALIVLAVYSTIRSSPRTQSGSPREATERPVRTPGGRLTLRTSPTARPVGTFDDGLAPALFAIAAVLSFAVVALSTWAAVEWWDDKHHYQPAYVLYGLIGLLWIVTPSALALFLNRDMPFPTLFRTVENLEDWLREHSRPKPLGQWYAWLVTYVVLAGLTILLLHLTLYPYPDITKIINPTG
jgi:hypothetical protein